MIGRQVAYKCSLVDSITHPCVPDTAVPPLPHSRPLLPIGLDGPAPAILNGRGRGSIDTGIHVSPMASKNGGEMQIELDMGLQEPEHTWDGCMAVDWGPLGPAPVEKKRLSDWKAFE